MLEKLMDNPVAWAVLAISTIASFVYAVITQHINKERKQLSYYQRSQSIIRDKKGKFDKLSVLYDGQLVDSICVSTVTIWNSGNRTINDSDIVESKELTLSLLEDNKILSADIIAVSEDTNNFKITMIDNSSMKILFDYVDKKEGVVIQIIHTGKSESVVINCKIKGGYPIKDVVDDSIPRAIAKVLDTEWFVKLSSIIICLGMILFFFVSVIFTIAIFDTSLQSTLDVLSDFKYFTSQGAAIVTSLLSWLTFLFIIVIWYPATKKIYRIGIPKSLKKY